MQTFTFWYPRVSMKRCPQCKCPFWNDKDLKEHIATHNRSREFICSYCRKSFFKRIRKNLHERTCDSNPNREVREHQQIGRGSTTDNLVLEQEAFNGAIKRYRYYFEGGLPIIESTEKLRELILNEVKIIIEETNHEFFKWHVGLKSVFHKASNPEILTEPAPYFRTLPLESYRSIPLYEKLEQAYTMLMESIDKYERSGSGWILKEHVYIELHIARTSNPLERDSDTESDEDVSDTDSDKED